MGVKRTVSGSNTSRPVRATVGIQPGGARRNILWHRTVAATAQRVVQLVEVPMHARNIHFYSDQAELPPKYEQTLQEVR
jgi:hypothetical protein